MKRLIQWIENYYCFLGGQDNKSLRAISRPLIQTSFERNGKSYQVRIGQVEDARAIEDLQKTAYSPSEIWSEDLLKKELSVNQNALYLLVFDQTHIIAFIGAWIRRDNCHVSNIVTRPEYRRQGIGYFLMEQMEVVARHQNCEKYSLEVRLSNTPAQDLYHRLGFQSIGVKKRYYSDNQEDALEMVKQLN